MGSLFSSFLKKEYHITKYGKVHSTMSGLSLLAMLVSITALIWHVWFIAGLVFLCISIIICNICFFYSALVLLAKYFTRDQEETEATKVSDELAPPASAQVKPIDTKD